MSDTPNDGNGPGEFPGADDPTEAMPVVEPQGTDPTQPNPVTPPPEAAHRATGGGARAAARARRGTRCCGVSPS